MVKPNIVIKAQDGSRIPYSNILSISPSRCGSGANDFAIVAIFDTENKAHPKDVLFTGTEQECNEWLMWFDEQLGQVIPDGSTAVLRYPEKIVWKNGYQTTREHLDKVERRFYLLHQEHTECKKKANKHTTIFDRVKVPPSEELIEAEEEFRKYFWSRDIS